MKKHEEAISLIDNGYGIVQLMGKMEIQKKDLISLAEENKILYDKLIKRFKNVEWVQSIKFKGAATLPLSDNDTPELAALKAEATKLGIQFNPNIGVDKLKSRIEEHKAKNQPLSDN